VCRRTPCLSANWALDLHDRRRRNDEETQRKVRVIRGGEEGERWEKPRERQVDMLVC